MRGGNAVNAETTLSVFPALAAVMAGRGASLLSACREVTLETGSLVFEPGQPCESYLLVRAGSIRVHLLDADGHEIVLYRLGRGDTCILTTAALLGATPYAAYAITETPTEATALPARAFEDLLAIQPAFRRFVFASHAARIADLMRVVSEVAFTRIQVRLARCLLQRSNASGRVDLTHDAIAAEIGTAREVVSRNLKQLERLGVLKLAIGSLDVLDSVRLISLSEP